MNIRICGLRALPALVLSALFLTLAMGLALLSSSVYCRIVDSAGQVAVQRTALSYLVNQVRRSDLAGSISYGEFGDGDAVFLREDGYITILYPHDGQLCELYMEQGGDLAPADGMEITALGGLSIAVRDGVMDFEIVDLSGTAHKASVAPRSGLQEERS